MVKVISFSLWGDNPFYNIGAIENAKTFHHFYPDFECWFYIHQKSVPKSTIQALQTIKNVKVIFKEGDLKSCKPRMWRFEPIDEKNIEIMLVRDSDSRITEREKVAVDEWIKSKKLFHIMRDHPHHTVPIMSGMFGTRKIPSIPCWKEKINTVKQIRDRDHDQDFLRDYIYPIIKNDAMIHANFYRIEKCCRYFPSEYNEKYDFVGMYVYPDNSISDRHMRILRKAVKRLKVQGINL